MSVLNTRQLMLILILPVATLGQERTGQDRRESAADRELRRRPWMRLLARAENAEEFLTSLTDKVEAHNHRIETLLTSDEGKHIASDGATLMTFIRVYEEPVVSASDVRRRKEAASSILRSVRVKQDSLGAGDPPAEDLQDEADELFFWSKERLARLSARETALVVRRYSIDGYSRRSFARGATGSLPASARRSTSNTGGPAASGTPASVNPSLQVQRSTRCVATETTRGFRPFAGQDSQESHRRLPGNLVRTHLQFQNHR